MPNKKKRIPFATGGWVNTQSGGDRPLSGETVLTREMQEALAEVIKPAAVPDVLIPKQHTVQFTIPKPDTLPDVCIDPSLLEQHPRMFEHSRQTGSGVSLRAKTTTNDTNYTNLAPVSNFSPEKFCNIKTNVYLCTVKTFKGHEAAAPKKAAYFMHGLRNMLLRHRVGYRTTTPKVHPLNDLDSA